MLSVTDVLFLLCLSLGVLSAPLPGRLPGSQGFLQDNLELSRKITLQAEKLRKQMCDHHGLCNEEELRLIRNNLGLHPMTLEQCHKDSFHLEGCFSQLSSGLRDFHKMVQELPNHLPEGELNRLAQDLEDLLANISEEMEAQGIINLNYPASRMPNYSSQFQEQVGTFLILSDLQRFMQEVQKVFGCGDKMNQGGCLLFNI